MGVKIRNQKCFLTANDVRARTRFRCENPITPSANAAASHVLGSGTAMKLSSTGSGLPRALAICTAIEVIGLLSESKPVNV
jgi:hypothetical protein